MITKLVKFKEAVANGIEMVGFRGVGFPTDNDQKPLNMTKVLLCEIDNKFYTEDDYLSLHTEYLKLGGRNLDGFNLYNLNKIILFLKKNMVS